MSFQNIKQFIKENVAALVAFVLSFGQICLILECLHRMAYLMSHHLSTNDILLSILSISWILCLSFSIAYPTIALSTQAHKIKILKSKLDDK